LEKRLKLLEEIDQEKSYTVLSENYGIECMTICDVSRTEEYYRNIKEMGMAKK